MESATPVCKHICNSHKPKRRPKIAKELTKPTQQKEIIKNAPRTTEKEE
jgi:hypothetical protein